MASFDSAAFDSDAFSTDAFDLDGGTSSGGSTPADPHQEEAYSRRHQMRLRLRLVIAFALFTTPILLA